MTSFKNRSICVEHNRSMHAYANRSICLNRKPVANCYFSLLLQMSRYERRTKRRMDRPSTSTRDYSESPPRRDDERAPWPRDDRTPIATFETFSDPSEAVRDRSCTHRPVSDTWDDYDSLFYNAWLDVDIEPTRFIDRATIRRLGIEPAITEMAEQLGLGTMATHSHDLYRPLVRQFLATAQLTYADPRARLASSGTLSFFARGRRYRITVPELCSIYGFEDPSATGTTVPSLPSLPAFWELIGTGVWNSNRATMTDIRHPALRYFLRAIACTLLCKMEPNKVRMQDLTLLYCSLDGLVDLRRFYTEEETVWAPNLGALFAEHLVGLKMKPFKGTGRKKETVGSLLTPIFQFLRIRVEEEEIDRARVYLDVEHLSSAGWLKEERYWSFRIGGQIRLIQLPHRASTDFSSDADCLGFEPDERLLRGLDEAPRRPPGPRGPRHAIREEQQDLPFPDFPTIPEPPMPQADFQRVVVDALRAIWARVTRPPCRSRGSVRARSPSAAGPSRRATPSDDEDTD